MTEITKRTDWDQFNAADYPDLEAAPRVSRTKVTACGRCDYWGAPQDVGHVWRVCRVPTGGPGTGLHPSGHRFHLNQRTGGCAWGSGGEVKKARK